MRTFFEGNNVGMFGQVQAELNWKVDESNGGHVMQNDWQGTLVSNLGEVLEQCTVGHVLLVVMWREQERIVSTALLHRLTDIDGFLQSCERNTIND